MLSRGPLPIEYTDILHTACILLTKCAPKHIYYCGRLLDGTSRGREIHGSAAEQVRKTESSHVTRLRLRVL